MLVTVVWAHPSRARLHSYGYKVNRMSIAKFTKMLEANKEFAPYPTNFCAREWTPEQLDRFCNALSGNQYLTTLKYARWRSRRVAGSPCKELADADSHACVPRTARPG